MSPSIPSATDAYAALSNYKAPDAGSVLTQAQGEAGLPAAQTRVSDLQGSVSNLQSSLNAVDPSVTGRTSGTFTTEGQRQALVSKEQAPIQTNLTAANSDLGTAVNNENTANGNANTYASAILGQNQQTYQQLLDQYNAAQAYETQQQTESDKAAALAEQAREANLTASTAASAANSGGTSAGSSAAASSAPAAAKITFKNGKNGSGGFAFTDANGNPINAGAYAQATGIPVGTLLKQMGAAGDTYSQQAYNEIQANQAYYNANPNALKSEFAPLFG